MLFNIILAFTNTAKNVSPNKYLQACRVVTRQHSKQFSKPGVAGREGKQQNPVKICAEK